MKPKGTTALLLLWLCLAGCTYGPVRNMSHFESARLMEDGNTVAFSAHLFAYRPATGLAAFPDGGIPKYTLDRNVVGFFDIPSGQFTRVFDEANKEFSPGAGNFTIVHTAGDFALLARGGQTRRGYKRGQQEMLYQTYLLDAKKSSLRELPVRRELAERGRAFGTFQALLPDGSLVMICPSLEEAERYRDWRNAEEVVPQIWLRRVDGTWQMVGATRHFERYVDGMLVWWEPQDRLYRFYRIEDRSLRTAPHWKDRPAYKHATRMAGEDPSGKQLRLGVMGEGGWDYTALPLTVDQLD